LKPQSAVAVAAVNFVYRLIKLAGARRVLFLVDRGNLGDQTLKDWSSSDKTSSEGEARRVSAGSANQFQQFVTPDDGRKFTELYNVQHLQSAQLDRVSRVCISTIQRLYSMLRSLYFWLKMFTARRDRHEETGIPLSEWHEAWHRVSSLII
jgi:type I restriction enzyme R subunit